MMDILPKIKMKARNWESLKTKVQSLIIKKTDSQRIVAGLLIMICGLVLPRYIQIYQFNVMNHLRESISNQNSGILIIASAKLVLLNTIRHVPIYTGAYVFGEGLNLKIPKYHLGLIISLSLIPIAYFVISGIYNFSLVFGGACYLTILTFFIVHRITEEINPIFIKVVINNLFLFGMDWLDVVPLLSRYGFGKGEVAIIIKRVTEFIGANYIMNFIGLTFSLTIVLTTMILLKVVIDNYHHLLLIEENERKEAILRRFQMEAVKLRYFLEIKHLVHDLKTPLVTIQGLSGVIKLKVKNTKVIEYVDKIASSAEKMSEMVSEILNENKMNRLDLQELIGFIKLQISLKETTHEILFQIPPDLHIYANKVRLSRAIINVIENGERAVNPKTGRIFVKAWTADRKVVIMVEDNGVGISADAIGRVWEAGYTTGPDNTGLGLNFVKEVIKNHQGDITIESTINVGTRVIISLPKATDELSFPSSDGRG
jgi:two-component system sporulation sensor kinase B